MVLGIRAAKDAVAARLTGRLAAVCQVYPDGDLDPAPPKMYATGLGPVVPVDQYPAVIVGGADLVATVPTEQTGVHRTTFRLQIAFHVRGNHPDTVDDQLDGLVACGRATLTVDPLLTPVVLVDVASFRERYSPLGAVADRFLRSCAVQVDVTVAETMPNQPVPPGTADTVTVTPSQLPDF